MKRGSEEFLLHSDYAFSLRAITQKKRVLTAIYDFSPVVCQKTFKTISTVPSYHSCYALPFQTELDLPKSSLKIEVEETEVSPHIFAPKPATQYCQICKQRFEDYMKHTSHPLHVRKVRQLHNELNFNSLKDIMNKRSQKTEQGLTFPGQKTARVYASPVKRDYKVGEEDILSGRYSTGSKKRIVVNHEGDLQVISVISSTKVVQSDGELSSQKSIRTFQVSKYQQS